MHSPISIRCGDCTLSAAFPDWVKVHSAAPRQNRSSIQNIEKLTSERLRASNLSDVLAKHRGRTLIICDDITRPTPVCSIMPALSAYLEELGIKLCAQHVLFATGTHRAVTDKEAEVKLGRLYGKIAWSCHSQDAEIIDLGATKGGIPIRVNAMLGRFQCIIGIGSVFPHRYCGWSGGGKIILPGISSAESVAATHWLPSRDGGIYLGSKSNTALTEIMDAAITAGLSFLIQSICSGDGAVSDIVAGTPEEAHRQAIAKAEENSGVHVCESDLIIASAWPEDIDLWQAGKALYSAENIVRKGGKILLVAGLREGVGTHTRFADLIKLGRRKTLEYNGCSDTMLSVEAAAAYVTRNVMEKANVFLLTSSEYAEEIQKTTGIRTFERIDEALGNMLTPDIKDVAVLHQAPFILPLKQ